MSRISGNQDGVLNVPMALMTVIFAVTGLGLWGILHHWKSLVQIQLRLDHCTGETAIELKSKLQSIASANRQIQALRLSEAAAPDPRIQAALKAAIGAEVIRQEAIRASWEADRLSWAVKLGCASGGDQSSPLPEVSWTRQPPDDLGSKPLEMDRFPDSYKIRVAHSPRASMAEVSSGDRHEKTSWHARWIHPQRLLGSGLD